MEWAPPIKLPARSVLGCQLYKVLQNFTLFELGLVIVWRLQTVTRGVFGFRIFALSGFRDELTDGQMARDCRRPPD
jgi:hypothetical protein